MKFTLEQNGSRWVASDGTQHVEGDGPVEAILDLLAAHAVGGDLAAAVDHQVESNQYGDLEEKIGRNCLTLVRLLAIRAPASIVLNELSVISKAIAELTDRFPDE